jgi:divalent metal cation (Fe/Co/Zn/Cd) transporter
MDEALDAESQRTIEAVLARFADPSRRFDHVFTRSAGQRRYVDLHMHMPADCSLGDAAAMRGAVEQALMDALPGLRASIQLLPTDREAAQVST